MEMIRKGARWYFAKGKNIRINNDNWYKPVWFKATGKQSCFNNWIYFPFAFTLNCFAKKGWPALNDNYYGKLICNEVLGSIQYGSLWQLSKNSINNSSVSDFPHSVVFLLYNVGAKYAILKILSYV